jgi:16S rRNA (uracil1498-N3)-methyltransferase
MPRIYCSAPLSEHTPLDLPQEAAKHCQVLRLQPLEGLTLFDGRGGEYDAQIVEMGRQSVRVLVHAHHPIERENKHHVHLIVGMPANERMDWLVEKATELGVQRITPVMSTRSVLRLSGERAVKKQLHWRGVALGACAQSGRNQIPWIDEPLSLASWCEQAAAKPLVQDEAKGPSEGESPLLKKLLSTRLLEREHDGMDTPGPARAPTSPTPPDWRQPQRLQVMSGPEGGFTLEEELVLQGLGFEPCSLGPRVLRAETAALVALARWGNA